MHAKKALACLIFLAAGYANTSLAGEKPWKLGFEGIGNLRIGMNFDEANRRLGGTLKRTAPQLRASPNCELVPLKNRAGVSLMFIDDTLQRIDVYAKRYQTLEGVKVGDPAKKVHDRYPALTESPREYSDMEKTLTVLSKDETLGIRFDTEQGKVASIFAGRHQAIMFSEGCL